MSDTAASASGARRELWPWFGHNGWKSAIAICATGAIPTNILPAWFTAVGTSLLVMAWFAMNDHERKLCDRCIAQWPLDPQAEVVKHDRALRGVHFLYNHRPRWGGRYGLSILFAVLFLAIYAPVSVFGPEWARWLVDAALNLVFIPWLLWVTYQHKRLDGWCPYCRHRGPGQMTADPVPQPTVRADR